MFQQDRASAEEKKGLLAAHRKPLFSQLLLSVGFRILCFLPASFFCDYSFFVGFCFFFCVLMFIFDFFLIFLLIFF